MPKTLCHGNTYRQEQSHCAVAPELSQRFLLDGLASRVGAKMRAVGPRIFQLQEKYNMRNRKGFTLRASDRGRHHRHSCRDRDSEVANTKTRRTSPR